MINQVLNIATAATNKVKASAHQFKTDWDNKTPAQKARFAVMGTVATIVNPILPIVYAGVYTATTNTDNKSDD